MGMALRLTDLGAAVTVYNRTSAKAQPAADAGATGPKDHRVRPPGPTSSCSASATRRQCAPCCSAPTERSTPWRRGDHDRLLDDELGLCHRDRRDRGLQGRSHARRLRDRQPIPHPRRRDPPHLGGDAGPSRPARPLLERLAKEVVHIGHNGAASSMKLALNLVMGAQTAACPRP